MKTIILLRHIRVSFDVCKTFHFRDHPTVIIAYGHYSYSSRVQKDLKMLPTTCSEKKSSSILIQNHLR